MKRNRAEHTKQQQTIEQHTNGQNGQKHFEKQQKTLCTNRRRTNFEALCINFNFKPASRLSDKANGQGYHAFTYLSYQKRYIHDERCKCKPFRRVAHSRNRRCTKIPGKGARRNSFISQEKKFVKQLHFTCTTASLFIPDYRLQTFPTIDGTKISF